jgi:integrase
LEFAILTAIRSGEALGARWEEFDLTSKVWVIKGERMKAGLEFRVPLSDQAMALLRSLPREGDQDGFVFIGPQRDRPLADKSLRGVLRVLGRSDVTVHGMRSAFRDWAANETHYPRELAEQALAHAAGNPTELAYRRGDALERRRKMMESWPAYCDRDVSADADVVALRRRK